MKECSWEKNISLFLDDELKKNEKKKFESHLANCETCKSKIEVMKKIDEKYDQLLENKSLEKVINAKNQSMIINNSIVIGSDLNTGNDSSIKVLIERAQKMKEGKGKRKYMKIFTFIVVVFLTMGIVEIKADFELKKIVIGLTQKKEVYICFTKQSYRDNLSKDDLRDFILSIKENLPFNFISTLENQEETWETIKLKQKGIQYALVLDIRKDNKAKGSATLYYQKPLQDMFWNNVKTVNAIAEGNYWKSTLSKNLSLELLSAMGLENKTNFDEINKRIDTIWLVLNGEQSESKFKNEEEIRKEINRVFDTLGEKCDRKQSINKLLDEIERIGGINE